MRLPIEFQDRMKRLLGEEYEAFLSGYEHTRQFGLRLNTMRMSEEEFEKICPFPVERIPWIRNGYSYGEGVLPARHPWYAAGVYYLQEPSAMTPASRLPVYPGERVLDLCAAPGGKATALAAALQGKGVLVANDISASRCKALLRNLELFGADNVFVTNETPERLAEVFGGFFDKILVDAPCSGEGMFRKSQEVADDWSPEKVEYFASQQRIILKSAAAMLRPGGLLLYSTCTFAPQEDEGTVQWFLEQEPRMRIQKMEPYQGFGQGRPDWIGSDREELKDCVRIWPHKMHGEGHFLTLFKKESEGELESVPEMAIPEQQDSFREEKKNKKKGKGKADRKESAGKQQIGFSKEEKAVLETFLAEQGIRLELSSLECRNGNVYKKTELPAGVSKLRFLRNGLYLGECKKGRFEPSQPFALSLGESAVRSSLRLKGEDPRLEQYLRGETLILTEDEVKEQGLSNGWLLVTADGFALGWGKLAGTVLKNKYPAGWRKNS
ncbi:MAG: RsmB/NOP family class I SAM-dependent RNA methyltransferase [Lachnospiraceae bacterium]|nr:RsmB/NOP family class I SAM-dependent RNA methyltransferase [Lachnospiraceae bacterium]